MTTYFGALVILGLLVTSNGSVLPGSIDVSKLQDILQVNLKSKEIGPLYFAIRGLKHLNEKLPDVCENIKNAKADLKNIEQMFYLTNAAYLSNCLRVLKPHVMTAATEVLDKKDATIPELYYAVFSLKALGKGTVYDKEEALKNLIQLLKKDDSPTNYGLVFGLCEHMGATNWVASHADGVLLAADESDGRLHFEGGLPATSQLLTTILRTFRAQKKPAPLTEEQRYKFALYLYSRRTLSTARGATLLLEAATALADDQPSPLSVSVKGKKFVTPDADSVEIQVCDLLGRAARGVRADDVLAQSGTRLADDVVVLSKQPLVPRDPTTFVLNVSKLKEQYGVYKIVLSVGSKTTSVNIAVLGEMSVDTAEIGVGDVDGASPPRLTAVTFPAPHPAPLNADHMQKVTIKFTVRDKNRKPVIVQQAFVRVASLDNERETIFVAEPDSSKAYKVELKVDAVGREVGARSGDYTLELFLGDSAAAAPQAWRLATVAFKFNAKGEVESEKRASGPRPEIAHTFRAPEPRPPRVVSDVFAALCGAPLLLLLALWLRLGVSLRLPLAAVPHAAVFHALLAGWVVLYGALWLRLSMFDAARYLLPLAALTFLAGHRLLRRLATKPAH